MLQRVDLITRELDNETVRQGMIQKWMEDRSNGWIIGTSCLIQVIDYQDVHIVVFVGSPWGMIDLVQGAGRGGRNGSMSQVVLIHEGEARGSKGDEDLGCAGEMKNWVNNESECRRLGISRCSGETTCQSLEGAALCDICKEDQEITSMLTDNPSFQMPSGGLPSVSLLPPTNSETELSTQLDMPELLPRPA